MREAPLPTVTASMALASHACPGWASQICTTVPTMPPRTRPGDTDTQTLATEPRA